MLGKTSQVCIPNLNHHCTRFFLGTCLHCSTQPPPEKDSSHRREPYKPDVTVPSPAPTSTTLRPQESTRATQSPVRTTPPTNAPLPKPSPSAPSPSPTTSPKTTTENPYEAPEETESYDIGRHYVTESYQEAHQPTVHQYGYSSEELETYQSKANSRESAEGPSAYEMPASSEYESPSSPSYQPPTAETTAHTFPVSDPYQVANNVPYREPAHTTKLTTEAPQQSYKAPVTSLPKEPSSTHPNPPPIANPPIPTRTSPEPSTSISRKTKLYREYDGSYLYGQPYEPIDAQKPNQPVPAIPASYDIPAQYEPPVEPSTVSYSPSANYHLAPSPSPYGSPPGRLYGYSASEAAPVPPTARSRPHGTFTFPQIAGHDVYPPPGHNNFPSSYSAYSAVPFPAGKWRVHGLPINTRPVPATLSEGR